MQVDPLSEPKCDKIRIVVADDHPLMRHALKDTLSKEEQFQLVGEACDGEQAVDLVNDLNPDVVIMDISMPKLSGLEATRQIKAGRPEVGILVLTVYSDSETVLSIMQAGADGYLLKSVRRDEVVKAVSAVAVGETVISPVVAKTLFRYAYQHIAKPIDLGTGDKLTARELELLKLLSRGISNKDIARKLSLSIRTVKAYLAEVFGKLGATSRTEAVVIGLRKGILTLSDLE